MDIQDFIKDFTDIFEETDVSNFESGTCFKDLSEWSSLLALGVIVLAKTKYKKTITGTEIIGCNTIGDLYHLIAAK